VKKTIIILCVFALSIEARESKILGYIGNFIPTLTEVGFVVNCVNVYEKVSQFVRVTNRLISCVRNAKSDWERTTSNIKKLYEDIQYLKGINPYDMDTWQAGVDNFNFSMNYHKYMAVEAFNCLEQNTIFASAEYIKSIATIDDYVKARNAKRKAVDAMFKHPNYEAEIDNAVTMMAEYKKKTIEQLRALQSADMLIIQNSASTKEEKDNATAHYTLVGQQISELETSASSSRQLGKTDSIINESGNLIAINLTEIQCCQDRLQEMEKSSGDLVAAFYRITGKQLNSQETGNGTQLPDIPIDPTDFDVTNPDEVGAPLKPMVTPDAGAADSRRETSNHDIINLQNAAAYLNLKQEALKRDIIAMKVNTMAYIVSMEATQRNRIQQQVILLGQQNRMVSIEMGE
jgi:hypothetical protein